MSVTEVSGDGEAPPPIIGAIMDAFHNMVSDLEKAEQEAKTEKKPELSELPLDGVAADFQAAGRLHLEALHLIGEMDAAKRAVRALGMELSGVEADGVNDAGHVYSLRYHGAKKRARRIMAALVREERNARVRLFEEMPRVFGDSLCRALAVMKNCRLLSPGERFDLLSPLRPAAREGMLDGIGAGEIEGMLSADDLTNSEDGMEQAERDRLDAERADEMNRRFEDVVLNERAEERFL